MIYTIVDSRICARCGARAGACRHLPRHDHQVEMASPWGSNTPRGLAWSVWEIKALEQLWETSLPISAIADRLNRTPNSVKSMAHQMGLRRAA